jgi:hypothetical protein
MKKVLWTGLVTGIAMLIGNMLLNPFINFVFPNLQAAYEANMAFRPWDDPIMMLFFLYPLMLGFPLAWIWNKTKKLFKKNAWVNGLNFGLIYLFTAGLPTFIINFSSFTFPIAMVGSWSLMGIVNGFVAGLVLARINR